jgi:uncharacterized RDD family membrane protein YckC
VGYIDKEPEVQQTVTRETVCAGFVDRLVAVIIDALILLIPNVIIYVVIGGTFGNLLSFLIGLAYAVYFWTSTGQTPGKKMMKLKVVKADGGNILTPGEAVIRYIAQIISGIPLFLGYLWVIWDPKHEAWHDKIASTKVLKLDA